eukprot:6206344-Pleurochrysis_carterae.AAC.2
MLYMVTTDSIKFKAKSWIDVFGGRASKVGRPTHTSFTAAPTPVLRPDFCADRGLSYHGTIASHCLLPRLF